MLRYFVPQALLLYYFLREPEEGTRGGREVHYWYGVSPALAAAPTRSTHGLHAILTSRQCLQGSLVKKTHQHFTRRARQIKASGSFVVRNRAIRHALATVASSPYQISHSFEAPTQASKL